MALENLQPLYQLSVDHLKNSLFHFYCNKSLVTEEKIAVWLWESSLMFNFNISHSPWMTRCTETLLASFKHRFSWISVCSQMFYVRPCGYKDKKAEPAWHLGISQSSEGCRLEDKPVSLYDTAWWMCEQKSVSAHSRIPNQAETVFPEDRMLDLTLSRIVGIGSARKWKKVIPEKESCVWKRWEAIEQGLEVKCHSWSWHNEREWAKGKVSKSCVYCGGSLAILLRVKGEYWRILSSEGTWHYLHIKKILALTWWLND